MQGYLIGKKMAEEKRKQNQANNPTPPPTVQEGPATGELKIKFNKNGTNTEIKMNADKMVAELINEYFVKTNTQSGTFSFNGNNLSPSDTNSLAETGLKDGSQINVS